MTLQIISYLSGIEPGSYRLQAEHPTYWATGASEEMRRNLRYVRHRITYPMQEAFYRTPAILLHPLFGGLGVRIFENTPSFGVFALLYFWTSELLLSNNPDILGQLFC